MLFSLAHKHKRLSISISARKTFFLCLCICLCASENSIRQTSGFVLLFMLMLMLRVFSLAYAYACAFAYALVKTSLGSLSNHDDDGKKNPHKFAYLTMKNSIFARFARAFFIFWHFEDVLVLSTTWNDLFCSCVDDVSTWSKMFNFVSLCPKRWFQFNSRS